MGRAWRAYYESHSMCAEEAIAKIKDGDTVVDVISTAEPDFRRQLYRDYLAYQQSCGMEEGLTEYIARNGYKKDWA